MRVGDAKDQKMQVQPCLHQSQIAGRGIAEKQIPVKEDLW